MDFNQVQPTQAQIVEAAAKKPELIGGKWFYEGVNIPEVEAQKILGVQPKPQITPEGLAALAAMQQQGQRPVSQRPGIIDQTIAEQNRLQKVGQNPIGAGADMVRESLAALFGGK